MKLIGFAVWEARGGRGNRNVTFPACQYSVSGERRSFSLLRPADGDAAAQNKVRELVLQAYAEYEESVLLPDLAPVPAEPANPARRSVGAQLSHLIHNPEAA